MVAFLYDCVISVKFTTVFTIVNPGKVDLKCNCRMFVRFLLYNFPCGIENDLFLITHQMSEEFH